jgi:asparagine synthase (glutamine-hydrolysing)
MRVGFCITGDNETVRFSLLGRSSLGRLLAIERARSVTAIMVGRLHYRDDLIGALAGRGNSLDTANDVTLILEAYRRWGREGLSRLEGCFALAVWDASERRLYARRDLMGGFPLYWGQRGRRLAVGTILQQVCAAVGAGAPDLEYEAEYLMLPTCGEHELPSERTPYQGVQRLLPQTILETDLVEGRAKVVKHWDWLDRLEEPVAHDLPTLAARYRELLQAAVRVRLVGPTAAHVSGGLDSTSVALLAAAEVERGEAEGPVHTISIVYDTMTVLAREREVIRTVVCDNRHLTPHFITGDGLLDFAPYSSPPDHEEPWPWLSMAGTEMARVEEAARAGVATVLTGQGADELLDMGPYHLTDLLRRGRLISAWRKACAAAHGENCGVWPILYPFGVQNLLPIWMRDGFGPILRGGYADWLHMGEYTIPPWIRLAYAKRYALRDRARARAQRFHQANRDTMLSVALEKIAGRSGDLGRWYLSAPRGILVEHPFLDPRLLCFLLGVHARVAPQPRTVSKPVLVEAMKGILPDSVRLRAKAGFFNEPYFRGLAYHATELEKLFCSGNSTPPEWLDQDVLRHCLRQSAMGIGNDRTQLDRLNVTLSWLRWLALPRTKWTTDQRDCSGPSFGYQGESSSKPEVAPTHSPRWCSTHTIEAPCRS